MGDALDASDEALYNFDTRAVHTAFMQVCKICIRKSVIRNTDTSKVFWVSCNCVQHRPVIRPMAACLHDNRSVNAQDLVQFSKFFGSAIRRMIG